MSAEQFRSLLTQRDTVPQGLTGTDPISVFREFSLDELPLRARGLAEDIGTFFRWVWPFFQAARTGHWIGGSATQSSNTSDADIDPIDEDAPPTLEKLSENHRFQSQN